MIRICIDQLYRSNQSKKIKKGGSNEIHIKICTGSNPIKPVPGS